MKVTTAEALEILEVEETADEIQIRKAYRRLAMQWHPDKNPDNEVEAKQQFQKIHAAYTKLQGDESDEEDEDEDFFNFFDDEDDMAAMFFEFMMYKMYGPNAPTIRVHSFHMPAYAQQRPNSSYGPPPSQQRRPPMGRPSSMGRSMVYSDKEEDDDEDEGDADFYFDKNEEREFLRQEQAKRDARARHARAQLAARAARDNAEADAKAERAREAEQAARAEAEETEALRRLCSQLPRPIMSARSETSITLSLARLVKSSGEDKLPKHCVWELEMREHPGGAWHTIHPVHDSLTAVADRLTPGTKYIFRACAARKCLNGSLEWGKYSEESHYATAGKAPSAGKAPAAAGAAAAQSDASKRGKRREAAVRKEAKRPQPQGSSRPQECEEEEERQRLQAEKAKAAAIKAAQERAAQDYEREVQQLHELKLASEARINEKVRKAKQKARKKEESLASADEAANAKPAVSNAPESSPPQRELPPRAPHYRAAPALRAYNESFAANFGSVQRTSPVGAGPPPVAARSRAASGPAMAAYGDEMDDAEMAQLIAALEESERSAREETEARQAMHMSDMAYPSLPTGTSPAKHQIQNGTPSKRLAAGSAATVTPHVSQPKAEVPPQSQNGQLRQSMHNGVPELVRKISSGYQPARNVTTTAVQPGPPPPHRQRSFNGPAAYSPPQQQMQLPRRMPPQQPSAYWGVPPQAHPQEADGELPPELRSAKYVPARQPAADSDWELPPEQHARQPVKILPTPQRTPIPVLAPKKVASQPARRVYNPNGAPARAPAQQAPMAGAGTSQPLPDLLQLLMPKAGA